MFSPISKDILCKHMWKYECACEAESISEGYYTHLHHKFGCCYAQIYILSDVYSIKKHVLHEHER